MWHPPYFLVVFFCLQVSHLGLIAHQLPIYGSDDHLSTCIPFEAVRTHNGYTLNLHFGSAGSSHHATTCPFLYDEGGDGLGSLLPS